MGFDFVWSVLFLFPISLLEIDNKIATFAAVYRSVAARGGELMHVALSPLTAITLYGHNCIYIQIQAKWCNIVYLPDTDCWAGAREYVVTVSSMLNIGDWLCRFIGVHLFDYDVIIILVFFFFNFTAQYPRLNHSFRKQRWDLVSRCEKKYMQKLREPEKFEPMGGNWTTV